MRTALLTLFLLAASLSLPACTTGKSDQPLPTLTELRQHRWAVEPPERPADPGPVMELVRIEMPASPLPPAALAMLQTQGLNDKAIESWRASGVHVGVLPGQSVSAFLNLCPTMTGIQRMVNAAADGLFPIDGAAPIPGDIKMTFQHQGQPHTESLSRGRMRLLLRTIDLNMSIMGLELLPQHQARKLHRPGQSKDVLLMEGQTYEELTLRGRMAPDHWLVLALNIPEPQSVPLEETPPPAPKDANPAAPTPNPAPPSPKLAAPPPPAPTAPPTDAATPAPQTPEPPAPAPTPFGDLLLSGLRWNRNMQLLILIRVLPPASN